MPPPGVNFIIRVLPSFLFPAAAFYGAFHLLEVEGSVSVSPWLRWIAIAAYYPLAFFVKHIRTEIWKRKDAARLGAQRVPKLRGKWIANIDIFRLLASSYERKAYIAHDFVPIRKSIGNLWNMNLFWTETVVTCEPEHIKQILATEFENFEKGPDWRNAADSLLGNGVFNADGDMWRFHRSMTRPFFSKERISHFELFARHADEALSLAKQRLRDGLAVDIQDVFARFTLDSATEFLFGRNVHSLGAGLPYPFDHPLAKQNDNEHPSNVFARAFVAAQEVVWTRTSAWDLWPLFEMFEDKTEEHMAVVKAFIYPIVDDVIKTRKEKLAKGVIVSPTTKEDIDDGETLLDHLVKYTDDEKVVKDEIINITVAGRDTTASLLTSVTYLLSQHPDVLKRLRDEILTIVGPSRNPTYDEIRRMKYMRAVLNETLRLFPPVPFDVRSSIHATTFSNSSPSGKPFYIPPNTTTSYSTWMMHRRTDLWGPDAEDFDPDRFLDVRVQKYLVPNPFIFVPFNAGPRICPGQQFAYNEASFMLVKVLQMFDGVELDEAAQPPESRVPAYWKELEGRASIEKFTPKSHLTLYAFQGLWCKLREAPFDSETLA